MIRIETTAEFDVEGKFTGKTSTPVPPGSHKVIVEFEAATLPTGLRKDGHIWVLDCVSAEDPDEVRQRLDDEATRHLLEGPFE